MSNRLVFGVTLFASAILLLSGCSAIQASRNSDMDKVLVEGNYKEAALLAESRLGLEPMPDGSLAPVQPNPKSVLDHLEAGNSWLMAGNVDRSISHFDAAEAALKNVETENLATVGAQQVAASLINDSVLDYVPSPAEAVLINFYKAIDFWHQKDFDNVRVELNRSGDRTRRAVDRYASEIAAAEAKAAKSKAGKTYSDPEVKSGVDARFPEMAQWAPYKEFIVPPAAYLQALFLGRSKDGDDHNKSADLYKRIVGLVDSNEAVQKDAQEAAVGQVCPSNHCIWVMAETGLGPELKEKRFDLPIPTTNGVLLVSMALPSLQSRSEADQAFHLAVNGKDIYVPVMGSMDRVIESEFQKRFPGVVTRAIISGTAKALVQNEVNKQESPLAGLLMNIVSAASTSADLRSWRSVPGHWSLVRIDLDAVQVGSNAGSPSFSPVDGGVGIEVASIGSVGVVLKDPVSEVIKEAANAPAPEFKTKKSKQSKRKQKVQPAQQLPEQESAPPLAVASVLAAAAASAPLHIPTQQLTLNTPKGPMNIDVSGEGCSLIYVKSISPSAMPVVEVLPL